jgi:hypothetical protein
MRRSRPKDYPPAKRPHSRVVTYDRGDVLVRSA